MSPLNARIGRSLPSPNLVLIRHQVCVRNGANTGKQTHISTRYVGALLVAALSLVLGTLVASDPRPAADPSECSTERPPAGAVLGAVSAVGSTPTSEAATTQCARQLPFSCRAEIAR